MTITEIPYQINDTFAAAWWSPATEYNGSHYVAFTSPSDEADKHYLNVAKMDENGVWTRNEITTHKYLDDYGHNQTSIEVDGDGYIHVFNSMHYNPWATNGGHYWRSENPEDITSMAVKAHELPNNASFYRFTYPITRRHPSGDVYLIIRRYDADDRRAPMIMYVWRVATKKWEVIARVADQPDAKAFVYPDDMAIAADGVVHMVFSWHKNTANSRRHRGSYLRYFPQTDQFKTVDNVVVSTPVLWTVSNLVYQPLFGDETTYHGEPLKGVQSASLSIEPSGYPSIAYRYRGKDGGVNEVKRARFTGGSWSREVIHDAVDTTAAIGVHHDGSEVKVYFVKKATEEFVVATKDAGGTWSFDTPLNVPVTRLFMNSGDFTYVSNEAQGKQYLVQWSN